MKTLTHIFVSILRDDVGIVPYKFSLCLHEKREVTFDRLFAGGYTPPLRHNFKNYISK